MKKKVNPAVILIGLIAVAAAVAAGIFFLSGSAYSNEYLSTSECFGLESKDEAAILLNQSLSEEKGFAADGKVYVPYDLAASLPGNPFYYDSSEGQLYLTTQHENTVWKASDSDGVFIVKNGIPYLDAEVFAKYSDEQVHVYADPARVLIRTEFKGIVTAEALENSALRDGPGRRNPITTPVAAGETLYFLAEEEKGWCLLASEDGFFGYMEEKQLILNKPVDLPHENNPLTDFDKIQAGQTVKMVWHYTDVQENNDILDYMLEDTEGINTLCPMWITLKNAKGDVDSLADADYAANARKRGMKLWTMIPDYAGGDAATGDILKNHDSRIRLEDQIMAIVLEYGLDGVNIDFETITEEQAPAYLQFLRELSRRTHEAGVILSVDNYVPLFTRHYDRTAQAKIVDYLIIMGYDEHTEYSEEPGSSASLPFVKEGIEMTLEEVPAEQIILGVPFFTRSWITPLESTVFETTALSMPAAKEFVREKGIRLTWNEELGQNTGSIQDNSSRYSIWMEDAKSLDLKLQLVGTYGLAGASAWRLGLETADVWEVWNKNLK